MSQNQDKIDLFFTSRGDFSNKNGDLFSTETDPLRSLFQEARTRVMSSIKDWKLYPTLGASLEDFVGEPNNKVIAEAIKVRIISSLTKDGFIPKNDISVKYLPIEHDRLMIRIQIKVAPTELNGNSTTLGIKVLYNYIENNISVVS